MERIATKQQREFMSIYQKNYTGGTFLLPKKLYQKMSDTTKSFAEATQHGDIIRTRVTKWAISLAQKNDINRK